MTFGSLFSGIGGIDLGLERAGMECKWQVEIDPYCQAVLAKHWPDVPRWDDVRTLTGGELERVDLIAGGPPCQPVSSAGKRRVGQDERWLWPEFDRILRVLRPRYALLENVSDLLVRGFGEIATDLADAGYDFEWSCLPAAVFGSPQARWRVFVIAHTNGGRCSERTQRDGTGAHYFGRLDLDGLAMAEHAATQASAVIRGMDARVPRRVDRNRALGNAVVPQVAEWIGRRILEATL